MLLNSLLVPAEPQGCLQSRWAVSGIQQRASGVAVLVLGHGGRCRPPSPGGPGRPDTSRLLGSWRVPSPGRARRRPRRTARSPAWLACSCRPGGSLVDQGPPDVARRDAEFPGDLFRALTACACSHNASVSIPRTARRPNRVSGSILTGEWGSSCGRHAEATLSFQVTRLTNESAAGIRSSWPLTVAPRQKSGSSCASS